MSAVWRRPLLIASEVLWRWATGVPLLLLTIAQARRLFPSFNLDTAALAAMTVFRPLDAFRTLRLTLAGIEPILMPVARWLVPLLLAAWTLAWSLGRGFVLNRMDGNLQTRPGTLLLLRAFRTSLLLALLGVGWLGASWAAASTISGPGLRGDEPNLVLFCALVICGSLLLYVSWAAVNWIVDAAPLLAMRDGLGAVSAVRAALGLGRARGKLLEINLVMSIVKIALIVLAMVFSASPLPFESVASQTFLVNWWIGVAVLYFLTSDFFHVVRSAAYLALFREDSGEILTSASQHKP